MLITSNEYPSKSQKGRKPSPAGKDNFVPTRQGAPGDTWRHQELAEAKAMINALGGNKNLTLQRSETSQLQNSENKTMLF